MVTRDMILDLAREADMARQPNLCDALLEMAGRFDEAYGKDVYRHDMGKSEAFARGVRLELRRHEAAKDCESMMAYEVFPWMRTGA